MDITRTIADSIYELQERLREKEHEEKKEDFQGKRINTITIDTKMYLIDDKTYNVYDINTFEFIGTYNSILDNSLEGFLENNMDVDVRIPRTSFISVAEYLKSLI